LASREAVRRSPRFQGFLVSALQQERQSSLAQIGGLAREQPFNPFRVVVAKIELLDGLKRRIAYIGGGVTDQIQQHLAHLGGLVFLLANDLGDLGATVTAHLRKVREKSLDRART
jgi:hypothetical protein